MAARAHHFLARRLQQNLSRHADPQGLPHVTQANTATAGLIAQRDLPLRDTFDRYELHMYKQWLRVYMRSKMIKHNKDLFQCLDDTDALLEKLPLY